jgi:FkbM family methyltransferase
MENMTLARIEYTEVQTIWRTPKGHEAVLNIREGTSDWNTVASILTYDEYGLKDLTMTGLALDVGAHIGAWAIAAALDNPELRVLAIEAIGENAELAAKNAYLSGVSNRVEVVHNAAAAPGVETADVFWRAQGTESFEHHAFIGNSSLVYNHGDTNHETETVACVSLGDVLQRGEVSFLKIDCEGCEWGFLTDPGIKHVEGIIGEWHPTGGHVQADIVALLEATHDVTLSGPAEGPGGFVAVRRA